MSCKPILCSQDEGHNLLWQSRVHLSVRCMQHCNFGETQHNLKQIRTSLQNLVQGRKKRAQNWRNPTSSQKLGENEEIHLHATFHPHSPWTSVPSPKQQELRSTQAVQWKPKVTVCCFGRAWCQYISTHAVLTLQIIWSLWCKNRTNEKRCQKCTNSLLLATNNKGKEE